MTGKKRKKSKPYDYRERVLAVKSEKRQLIERNQAMSSPTPSPVAKPSGNRGQQQATESAPVQTETSESPTPVRDAGSEASESLAAENKGAEVKPDTSSRKGDTSRKKAKAEPETLEQFIEYCYSRKGQRLALKPKVERLIAQNVQLEDAAREKLLRLADTDTLLAVPRQILLVSLDLKSLPRLRASLNDFVRDVMTRHPLFEDPAVQSVIRNLPDAFPPTETIARVADFEPRTSGGQQPLKSAELQELRGNAVRLLITWLAVDRGLSIDELSLLLAQSVLQPAANELVDDSARVRALTDIGSHAGMGLVCQRLRQQITEARAREDRSQREAASLRDRLMESEARLVEAGRQLEALRADLQTLKESSSVEMEALRRQQTISRTHLQHDLEQLRGRLAKHLTDSVDMLEVGLTALRKDTPRVPVMVERAEHVVDSLRAEIQALREE